MTGPTQFPTPAGSGRRRLLAGAAAGLLVAAAAPARARAALHPAAPDAATARIALLNTHTGERLDLVYREAGVHVRGALAEIDRLLRDHRSGEVAPIDPGLLDQLHALGARLDARQPFHVISGYRSPATNARLAAAGGGVARDSLHLRGCAIDLRLPGRSLSEVRAAALSLQAGGVGFYPRSDFVHIDTGRVRSW